ncbi:DUF554 domain-containing protein [Paenibacillus sp. GCM10023248]|uniref:DUF554 domain-containing protein n=1 Tax=Bacillales TaxID=1385 RepID=UPI0023781D62|nr:MULTISPECIES: DUF554 domain-containing protein [Bacillales]MDD9271042.1 DUF554 domain-containing protein [Paenibacillus sp. MAHUQ-63]MDR6882820.1 putative membrane protein YqgA involved in biofilm formation [Bacillus sp. 3255]
MALWGTMVNAIAIIVGGLLGMALPRISEGIKSTVMQGLGLAITVLGITMAFKSNNIVLVIMSLVAGGIAGELLRIEYRLAQLGDWLQARMNQANAGNATGRISEGFVTCTLVYCIGAMAILGPLDGGLRHNHDILYTKALLDGFLSIIFASTLGVGVIFSAASVFIMQGTIALAATFIAMAFSQASLDAMIVQITAVGGVLVIGVGINILQIRKVNVANMLPALVIAAAAVPLQQHMAEWWQRFF